MAWKKGQSGNPDGKDPGTLNEATSALKNWFINFSYNNTPKIQKAYDYVLKEDPAEALRLFIMFSERVVGKVSSSTVDITSAGKELKAPVIHVVGDTPA